MPELDIRHNNFDLLRLFAAAQVAILHVAQNLEVELPRTVTYVLGYFPGVPIFFVISGFLISASFDRNPNLWNYATNRFLRIYPALWFSTLLTLGLLILFGPRVWSALQDSGQSPIFVVSKWLAAQLTVGQFYNPHLLKANYGVGHLNGSLWTIPVELQFYAVLPFITPWWGRQQNTRLLALIAAMFAVSWLYKRATLSEDLDLLTRVTLLPYLYMFLLGVILQRNHQRLSKLLLKKGVLWLLAYVVVAFGLSLFNVSPHTNTPNILSMTLLAAAVVSLAFTRRDMSEKLLKGNDISYGTYIYHMIVANLAFEAGFSQTMSAFVIVLAATVVLAVLSWVMIEKPALALKQNPLFSRLSRKVSEEKQL